MDGIGVQLGEEYEKGNVITISDVAEAVGVSKRQSAGQYPEREESVRQQGKKSWLI